MSTETNKAKVREFFGHADTHDFTAWRACLAGTFAASMNGGDTMTADQFQGVAQGILSAFSNGRHIIEKQLAEGDWVATRLSWTAVHTGAFNGVPASNRPVRISAQALDLIRDGRIAEHHTQIDMMGLMVQVGAIPMAA